MNEHHRLSCFAALRVATALDLTRRFGRGHWSGEASARGVLADLPDSTIWIARRGSSIVATFRVDDKAMGDRWVVLHGICPSTLPHGHGGAARFAGRDVAHVAYRGVPLVYYEMPIPSNLEMQ